MTSPATTASSTSNEKPAIIATRQHCEAEGVGLSHYILMDRKAAPATPDAAVSTPDAAA